ncbi:anti-sigma factor [Neobacillus sp. Marseille-QA0830]
MTEDKNQVDQEYEVYLKESLDGMDQIPSYPEKKQTEFVKIGKSMARKTNIMISLAVLLLIVPIMTLATYLYYGTDSRADRLIEVATDTIYVTEPNMSLKKLDVEDDIGFFSMNITFDVFKRIGKEDYKAGDYDIHFLLGQAEFPKKNLLLDRPLAENPSKETGVLFHPDAIMPYSAKDGWDTLNKLPDGTVSEIYVSFDHLMDPQQLEKSLPQNMELRWVAVDTGLEKVQVDKEGVPITPLGYPVQPDQETWSPFKDGDNQQAFLDILSQLKKNEAVAEKVARAKSLSISSRLAYIKKHGIKVYGAVITGPTEELRKLHDREDIRAIKIGEVKLWNWE